MRPANSERFERNALLVSTQSVLKRRRQSAAYALSELPLANKTRRTVLIIAVGCVFLFILGRIGFRPPPTPEVRPLSVANPTRVNEFDRFSIPYLVRDGDTLWRIAARYYGSPSPKNIQRIRAANPWLSKNDQELRIGVTLKIPVI